MQLVRNVFFASAFSACTMALAQAPTVLRDLDAASRVTLSKDELVQLLPGAAMSRLSSKGNRHNWTNDADGTFIISSDNRDRDRGKRASTAQGKWHISDDGRYCVLIEWKTIDTEDWCRLIIRAGEEYYGAKSVKNEAEKVYKLEISKK